MKTSSLALLFGVAALVLTGCSTVSVQTDYDHAASFGQYHTYTLASAAAGETLSPSGEAALCNALRTSLAVRGIVEVTGKTADLEVVRHVFTRNEVTVQQYNNWGYGGGGRWPGRYGNYAMWSGAPITYTDVNDYLVGTLVIDFVDAKTRKLVFRGTGTGTVGSSHANAKSIETAVKKMFRNFPKVAAP